MGSPFPQLHALYRQLRQITTSLAKSAASGMDAATLRSLLADRTQVIAALDALLAEAHRWVAGAPAAEAQAERAALDATIAAARAIHAQDAGIRSLFAETLAALRSQSAMLQKGRRVLRSYRPARESDACAVIDRQG